jgi:hypothetical protein
MEEAIEVRYLFVMMLAIADPEGYVIGTDVAIARRINMELDEFKDCLTVLMNPDPSSNSKEKEGRRVIPSDCERGYHIVNYVNYRDTKDPIQRRKYMREYMKQRRGKTDPVSTVLTPVNICKPKLTQATAEAEATAEETFTGKKSRKPKKEQWTKPHDADDASWDAWMAIRKKANAINSEYSWKLIQHEAKKAGMTIPQVIARCAKGTGGKGWVGFDADWVLKDKHNDTDEYQDLSKLGM